jgi:hypothetical protein
VDSSLLGVGEKIHTEISAKVIVLMQRPIARTVPSGKFAGPSFSVSVVSARSWTAEVGEVEITTRVETTSAMYEGDEDDDLVLETSAAGGVSAVVVAAAAAATLLAVFVMAAVRRRRPSDDAGWVRNSLQKDGVPPEQMLADLWMKSGTQSGTNNKPVQDSGTACTADALPVGDAAKLVMGASIGAGGCSTVYQGLFGGYKCCLKIFHPSNANTLALGVMSSTDEAGDNHARKQLRRELSVTASVRHPCVIRLYCVAVLPPGFGSSARSTMVRSSTPLVIEGEAGKSRFCLVTELAQGGTHGKAMTQWRWQWRQQTREPQKVPTRMQLLVNKARAASVLVSARDAKGTRSQQSGPAEVVVPYQAHFAHVLIIARQIAEGCHFLHHRGILHRDLKPDNILLMEPLAEDGSMETTRVKIADFSRYCTLHTIPYALY